MELTVELQLNGFIVDPLQTERVLADRLAPPMFLLTLVFIGIVAGLIVTLIDIPRVTELTLLETEDGVPNSATVDQAINRAQSSAVLGRYLFLALLALWPLYLMEFCLMLWQRLQFETLRDSRVAVMRGLLVCLIPPLRLGLLSNAWGDRLWFPTISWQHPGKALSRTLQKALGKPMLAVAFLILPILLLEYGFGALLYRHEWLRITLHICTGFIWWCFTVEFIVCISSADNKSVYVKNNWIDLVIILLPLVSFLRSIRALRLAKLAKVQQLSKMTRVYRLKGLGTKAIKSLVVVEFLNRLINASPEKNLAKLREQYDEHSEALDELAEKIRVLEAQIASNDTHDKQNS